MLPPLQEVVLPLDPVINRQTTVILPSPIMPLWMLLAKMAVPSVNGLNASGKATVTISGNASVNAEVFRHSPAAIGSH